MTSLLDLIGEDQDLLQPVITQLWSTLAKARAWSALTATLNWTRNSLARPAHPWKVSQDHHLTAALAAITQAGNAQDGSSPGASLVKVVRDVLQKMDNQ